MDYSLDSLEGSAIRATEGETRSSDYGHVLPGLG